MIRNITISRYRYINVSELMDATLFSVYFVRDCYCVLLCVHRKPEINPSRSNIHTVLAQQSSLTPSFTFYYVTQQSHVHSFFSSSAVLFFSTAVLFSSSAVLCSSSAALYSFSAVLFSSSAVLCSSSAVLFSSSAVLFSSSAVTEVYEYVF